MDTLPFRPDVAMERSTLPPHGNTTTYAIAFDLDMESLNRLYPGNAPNNGYRDVRELLVEMGFRWQQGSVYFGDPGRIDAVACVLAAQRLTRELSWFAGSVRDIRILRIEENDDLFPAISNL